MKNRLVPFFFVLITLFSSCNREARAQEKVITSPGKLPQGQFTFELYFSEFGGQLQNQTCSVKITGNQAVIISDNKDVIYQGLILYHDSGVWILSSRDTDISAKEIGGCTEIPIIDFEKKVIEWC